MGFQLKKDEYYLIRQIIDSKKPIQFELRLTNEESIIKFTRILAGTVAVYIYNRKTNQRIDMTENLGRSYRPLDEFREIYKTKLMFMAKGDHPLDPECYINNVYIYQDMAKYIIGNNREEKPIYYVMRFKLSENKYEYSYKVLKKYEFYHYWVNPENTIEQQIKIKTYGDEYEKFIGTKYESIGKRVIYHGLNKGKKDNGIDLIIDEEKIITFVQCKNWKSMGHYKLNQKDLRAFIGDCYMYMHNKNINKKHNFHFIVSDAELLTKSAEYYLKDNTKLKYKVIPFEEER